MNTEIRIPKSETSTKHEARSTKRYDLEARTLQFARDIRTFVRELPQDTTTREDIKQLVRSSGSIGANYIEANESLSKKDFVMRLKISKKESRETIWWLELLSVPSPLISRHGCLLQEATELMKILGAILRSSER